VPIELIKEIIREIRENKHKISETSEILDDLQSKQAEKDD